MYVDGFLLVIPKKNIETYRTMAYKASKIWRKHGALQYCEAVGDDLKTPMGMPFPKLAKIKPSETAVFAWIVYKTRAHRDRVNAKVMKDPQLMQTMPKVMPFDIKKMSYGGFKVIVKF